MDVFSAILGRRSVRDFTGDGVGDDAAEKILEAGRWAPSGLNNQPWKFKVVRDSETKKKLAACTKYCSIIENAPLSICVFLDNEESYDRTKDVQAVGACIQNMLLAVHAQGLGAVWLGEILNKRKQVEEILAAPKSCELMAVIAVGRPKLASTKGSRKKLSELAL
jgi:nitroreductase